MKKQLLRKCGTITVLLSVFVFTFLGLGACTNPLQDPAERGAGGSADGTTGVRISIVAGEARTLLPGASFSKYEVSFSTDDSVTIPPDVTLTDGDTSDVIALEPADWTITVTAYVGEDGSYVAAAEGEAEVSLAADELKVVDIRVSSKLDGDDGYFSYDIDYPADVTLAYGDLNIYGAGPPIYRDLSSDPSEEDISLPPGYYRLEVRLVTSDGMAAVRTEIVHIYPGMETRWDYTFDDDDFGSPIAISGSVDLSGLDVSWAEIRLYRDPDFMFPEGSYCYEDNLSANWEWKVSTLPFSKPTDIYIELMIDLAGGPLQIRIPAPLSVYDEDLTFTVNRFSLSGEVDFSALTDLGIDPSVAWVEVYQDGDTPVGLGAVLVDPPSDLDDPWPWSCALFTPEESLPVRIVLGAGMSNGGTVYDEIQIEDLSSDESGHNFNPGPVSAGTPYNRITPYGDYWYLFVPDVTGRYAFKLSGDGPRGVGIELHDASGMWLGSAGGNSSETELFSVDPLTAGEPYYIRLNLDSPGRAFEFRVDPVGQANLGGTVDFSGLLSRFSGVTVLNANIEVYADSNAHTPLGGMPPNTIDVNTSDGSWSATVDLGAPSAPAVFVITAFLDNGQTINHQVYNIDIISGDNSSLDFRFDAVFDAVTEENALPRTTINGDDVFLYVPEAAGTYSLTVNPGPDRSIELRLYDAETGSPPVSIYGDGEIELIQALEAKKPYAIEVHSYGHPFVSYEFRAVEQRMVTLEGNVDLSGLAPHLTNDNIDYTNIWVFNGASNPITLGAPTVEGGGAWSVSVPIPVSGTREVRIEAYIALNNNLLIIAHRQDTISGNTPDLTLAPVVVSPAGGQPVSRETGFDGYYGIDAFLFVPTESGLFNLEAIRGGSSAPGLPPGLTLYDAETGDTLAGGPGSQQAPLTAGTPYVVEVYMESFTPYQFRVEEVPQP